MSQSKETPAPRFASLRRFVGRILYSRWVGIAVCVALVVGTIAWFLTRDALPRTIRIAAGEPGGQYHAYAHALRADLAKQSEREIEVVETAGSGANRTLLVEGKAELAIIQNGAIPMRDLIAVAPLFKDVVHIVVREGREIETVDDFPGRNVILGKPGSGMRESAKTILDHYDIDIENLGTHTTEYFTALNDDETLDETLDAAIVTTGFVNGSLQNLLKTGKFKLLGIHAEAVALHHAYWSTIRIPHGLYREGQNPVPAYDISTVATSAVLVAKADVDPRLVDAVVATLYEGYPHWDGVNPNEEVTALMTADQARQWSDLPLHERTRRYLNPRHGFGVLKQAEELAAMKELLFALGAGIYFLWLWQKRRKQEVARQRLATQRKTLNGFLDETRQVEVAQMKTDDASLLREHLDAVTRIKLRALEELTDEDLRGDQLFSIFLMQCSNLMRKIQMKIVTLAR